MPADGVQTQTHRDHSDVCATRLTPTINLAREFVHVGSTERYVIPAKVFNGPAEFANSLTQPPPGADGVNPATEEYETVREPGGPLERLLA